MKKARLLSLALLGIRWLIALYSKGLNGILADEMGLGKRRAEQDALRGHLWELGEVGQQRQLQQGPQGPPQQEQLPKQQLQAEAQAQERVRAGQARDWYAARSGVGLPPVHATSLRAQNLSWQLSCGAVKPRSRAWRGQVGAVGGLALCRQQPSDW